MIINEFSTHLPVLNIVKDFTDKNSVFEYGMGEYSTKFFSNNFKNVTSVEMQDKVWFEKISNLNLPNVNTLCMIGDSPAVDYFKKLNSNFSCVFVDGHGGNRWECINEAFNHTDIIIAHDTEERGYKWNLVNLPSHFTWLDICSYNPWTSVLTTNKDLIEILKSQFITKERN